MSATPIEADTEFALLSGDHYAACVECGKHATVLVITSRSYDGVLHGPTYCSVHFVIVASRAVGIRPPRYQSQP